MTDVLLFWISVGIYAIATLLFWIAWIFRKESLLSYAVVSLWVGLLIHGLSLVARWISIGHGPYINRYEVFSSNAWVFFCVFLVAQQIIKKIRPAGAVIAPLGLIMMGVAGTFSSASLQPPPTFDSNWLIVHILFAKMAYGSLLLAAGLSALYLLKSRKLAAGEPGVYGWLPKLEITDELIYRFTLLGFVALAVMIIAGALWAHKSWGRYWGWDPVETWALLTWLVYGLYIHLRRTRGWKGKKTAWYSLGAFILVVILAFGVTTFINSIHTFYFVE